MSYQFIQSFMGKNVTWMLGQAGSICSDAGARRTGASASDAFFSTYSLYFRSGHVPMRSLLLGCNITATVGRSCSRGNSRPRESAVVFSSHDPPTGTHRKHGMNHALRWIDI